MSVDVPFIGAACFGAVVGWMGHNVLQRAATVDVKWLGSMIAVLGGGAVTALFTPRTEFFGWYCVGLALAFFGRVVALPVITWFGRILQHETDRELTAPPSHQ